MTSQITKPFILVDGSSYLYRAFHALPPLVNSKGEPTGAVYGVINMLRKLITDYNPDYIAVVFDAKGRTFRDDLFEHYKAHRPPMPNELAQQIEPLHRIIRAMGVPLLIVEGVEADDVIGTLAKQAAEKKMETLISTGDKDLAQLVDQHITLINTMNNSIFTPQSVIEKFGVPPESIIDYLALVGDSADNIPGVPQCGPKTAVKWLQQYHSLEKVMEHAGEIKGKVGENLRASLTQLPLAKALATIKLDVDLNLSFQALKRGKLDQATLTTLYQELEFKNWLTELTKNNPEKISDKYAQYETILTESQFDVWLKKLNAASLIAFDTETTSLNYMEAKIVGMSFAIAPGEAAYLPLAHDYPDAVKQLSREDILKKLTPLLENENIKKIGHNIKYDIEVLANYHIILRGMVFDTTLESFILESTRNRHDMDSLAMKFLHWNTIRFEDIAGKGTKQLSFNQIAIEKAAIYAAEDADVALQLHHAMWSRLSKEPGLKYIFENIEMPLIAVLARIERNGVLIDAKMLEKQTEELEKRLQELEKETFAQAGQAFNLSSPKQLQEILFEKLKLPVLQKTPTGQASTADNVLQELAVDYFLPKLIIEYRSLSKLITTYTKRLPEQINPHTQRVHTSYNQIGAATGRLSSSDPNLQNIPVRTQEGRRIRQAFIAPKGYKMISADYSQIELRIMAHISSDANLLKAFADNLDIHTATAAEVLGIPIEKVTHDERRSAKAINFGLIYGMSAFGLAKQLDVERHAAQQYIDRYFARYPGVKKYMENTRALAHAQGYVETIFGRRLYLPEINSSQVFRQKAAERTAINAPLQGTAADIIKLAMISLDQWLQQHKQYDAKIVMQVHDELVLEVKEDHVDKLTSVIREHMMNAAKLKVPLLVSIGKGASWGAASED